MTTTHNLNDKEFESILKLQGAKRYEHLVSRVSDWEAVWGLRGDDGWCAAADGDGHSAFPIWPHPRYAQSCAIGDWGEGVPTAIAVQAFADEWLPNMAQEGLLIAVFPTPSDAAVFVSPLQLQAALREALDQYE